MSDGDHITVGDITHAAGVAIGQGASAQVYQGGIHLHVVTPADSQQAQMALDPDMLRSLLAFAQLQPEQPLPRMEDIFEIIDDPDQVIAAVFRMESGQGLPPYEIDYIKAREGTDDMQQTLTESLLDAGGMLLLHSRAGLGKTREVAELAEYFCRRHGWVVCVSRGGEADKALNRLADFPEALHDKRLLLIFDDLHRRVCSSGQEQIPYAERLADLLDYLSQQMSPGSLRVLGTARSEPHHWKRLGFEQDRAPWRLFGLYELPEFTVAGLQQILRGLARQAHVELAEEDISTMVINSDRTLRTLLDNVNFAASGSRPLTLESWLPTQGESWDMRYREARGLYPGVQAVYEAIHLIREAGVTTRIPYVSQLSSQLSGAETQPAVEGLINMGLLGKRANILDAFSDEQLLDSLKNTGGILPALDDNWDKVIHAISEAPDRPRAWPSDLATLTSRLNKALQFEKSIGVVDAAIDQSVDEADLFYNRGYARAQIDDFAGAEQDFTAVIQRVQDDAAIYISRAGARFSLADYAGAEEDLTTAVERGAAYAMVFAGRGAARALRGNYAQAETDLNTAIDLGQDSADVYLARGGARYYSEDYAGAVEDFTTAIERGMDSSELYLLRAVARTQDNDLDGLEEDLTAAIERGQEAAWAFLLRGSLRQDNGDFAGALDDLSAAIERGQDDANVFLLRGDARFTLSDFTGAEADYSAAVERGWDEAPVFYYRGLARFKIGDYAGAEADYTAAVERGKDDAAVYVARGDARANNLHYMGAEADYTAAVERGLDEAPVYFFRGLVRAENGDFAGAIADYTLAMERGRDDADVYFRRAKARSSNLDAVGALADFEAAVERGLDDADVHYRRGIARQVNGDNEGAEADFSAAIERGKDDGDVYYWRGRVRNDNADPLGAEKDLLAAVERGRDDANVYKYLGWARIGNGNFAAAEVDLTTAIERGEDSAFIYYLRAGARSENGDYAGSEADYTAVIERSPDYADTYYQRGLLRYYVRNYPGAEADFADAINLGHDDAETFSAQGLARRQLGRWTEAVESYRRAVERDPSRTLDWLGLAASARTAGDDTLWQEAVERARPLADGDDQYDAACFYSVAGKIAQALEILRLLLPQQPKLIEQAKNDPDLYWVRQDPRFTSLVEEASSP